MRQHVNPLSRFFQLPKELPSVTELFIESNKPIHLDIGSAKGLFVLDLAEYKPDWNFLGLEIREKLVLAANREVAKRDLKNVRFCYCNANISLDNWLNNLPFGLLQSVSIQFPDPWFKRKHHKRRVLQKTLLLSLAKVMIQDAKFFIQSDVVETFQPMIDLLDRSSYFDSIDPLEKISSNKNPFPVKTEREQYVLKKGLPIYRALYSRNNNLNF